MHILGILSGCMLVYPIVRHNRFFDNILQYVHLLDISQRLSGLTVEKRLYSVQRFISHLLVRYKTILISRLEIAGFMEQVLGISALSLGGHSLKNHNCIAGGYVYHVTYSYELIDYRNTFKALQKVGNLRKAIWETELLC